MYGRVRKVPGKPAQEGRLLRIIVQLSYLNCPEKGVSVQSKNSMVHSLGDGEYQ